MLNILITGSKGQLGSEIREASAAYPYFRFFFTDIDELDITNQLTVADFFRDNSIDVVLNCAAYTAVDKAEQEPGVAMLINRDAVINLATACRLNEAYMIHISTDYVFDGHGKRPYRESDPTHPASSYGKSKKAGEDAMLSCLDKGMIIRTSWLYSTFGSNFIKTILKKGRELGELNVVNDQVGCPTYAHDLATTILGLIPRAMSQHKMEIYHYSNEGYCNWYEFATEAVGMAGITVKVNPVSSLMYVQLAPRPDYSILDKTKIKEHFGLAIPHWKDSLADCIRKLKV
jgi:dTDP-4-dehydrorhamnose reductase